MKRFQWVGMTALLGIVVLAGCQNSEAPPTQPAAETSGKETEASNGLADLSPKDRPLAEAQRLCPVTGDALGEMGTPVKVDVKGQTVFLCCDSCKKKALDNPDKTLAKVEKFKLAGR